MTALVQSIRIELPPQLTRALLIAAAMAALAIGGNAAGQSDMSLPVLALIALVFALAGYVKGLTAIGLPTVGIALLSFVMPIPEAMALVALPAFASNFWQAVNGGQFFALLRRLSPLVLPLMVTATVTVWLLGRGAPSWALAVLALVLMAYGAMGLLKLRPRVPATAEGACSPAIGVASGFLAGLVGVPIMPVLPYLQALNLKTEQFVQALGIVFCAASIAVGIAMTGAGVVDTPKAALSVAAVVPTLAGMAAGQAMRRKLSVEQFKTGIFVALLVIGLISLCR